MFEEIRDMAAAIQNEIIREMAFHSRDTKKQRNSMILDRILKGFSEHHNAPPPPVGDDVDD